MQELLLDLKHIFLLHCGKHDEYGTKLIRQIIWHHVDELQISHCCTDGLEARRDKVSHRCMTNFIFTKTSCRII